MVVIGQRGCIKANLGYSEKVFVFGKVVVFGQKCFYLGKCGLLVQKWL